MSTLGIEDRGRGRKVLVLEKITIKNVIYILAKVWVKIRENTLKNTWRSLSFGFDKKNFPNTEVPRIFSFQTFISGKNIHTKFNILIG